MSIKNFQFNYIIWVAVGISIAAISYFLSYYSESGILFSPLMILMMFIFIQFIYIENKYEKYVVHLLIGISFFLIIKLCYDLYKTYLVIPDWDFLSFYMYSLAGQSGENIYDPALYKEIFDNLQDKLNIRSSFIEASVEVGFVYPPPTMIILYPLGWVDLYTGFIIWQSIMIAFLLLSLYLLITYFSKDIKLTNSSNLNLLVIIISILLFPNLLLTIKLSQTNFIFLFFLILMLKKPKHWSSGIFLILLIMIKPLAIFFSIYFILEKDWKVLTTAFISGIIVLLFTGLILGFDTFLYFFSSPPTRRIPEWVFSEPINNSLSAILIRLNDKLLIIKDKSLLMIFTILISFLFLLITSIASWQLSKKSSYLSLITFIPMSLLIYPGTLSHYSIFLIPVIFLIWKLILTKNSFSLNLAIIIIIYITGLFGLFYLNILLMTILFYWAFKDRMCLRRIFT